jgi:acyl-CoA synthetase (AMP-forming)/AMP-acid ligase II
MLPALLSAHSDSEPLGYETIIYGAAPIPEPLLEQTMDRFGPILSQIYGQSEAPMTLTVLDKASHAKPGDHRMSAGRAWRTVAVEVRSPDGQIVPVGEQGEVTIAGPHHMTGYLGLEAATAEVLRDGWVWTKDIGTIDEQGFVYLLGRRDEMINSGGFNISPREVEHVLQDHPAVAECAVVGRPDPKWGAAVTAMVQLHASAGTTVADILEFARPRLTFRTPKAIVISDAIPRNPYGKVDRSEVLRVLAASESDGANAR